MQHMHLTLSLEPAQLTQMPHAFANLAHTREEDEDRAAK